MKFGTLQRHEWSQRMRVGQVQATHTLQRLSASMGHTSLIPDGYDSPVEYGVFVALRSSIHPWQT